MKGHLLFLVLTYSLWVTVVEGGGPLLPPPSDALTSQDDETRGIKGNYALGNTLKSNAKCTVEGSYGIKNECRQYTDCKLGQAPSARYCPDGKSFDHKKRICVKSSVAECINVCPNDGDMFPDPSDVKRFLKCHRGILLSDICKDSKNFHPTKRTCSFESIPIVASDEQ